MKKILMFQDYYYVGGIEKIIKYLKDNLNNNFDKTLKEAFKQIEEKKYDTEFKDLYKVNKIAIVFKGK